MPKKKGPNPNLMYERQIHHQGYRFILGMDEVGRGAWAGPVTVGAVCLPLDRRDLNKILTDVRDSKVMTPRQRERTDETIKETALAWGIGSATNSEIDEHGINPATKLAMGRALDDAISRFPNFQPDCLFLDAMIWPEKAAELPQITIVDGDARSLTIAAASIIAKVWRDQHMRDLDTELPQYRFGTHKGYGTGTHTWAIKTFGATPLHRMSYAPVQKAEASRND
ncbi:MAG: ribonuclease HII [Anaerolineaceae bacterium]|nr:ribonuclease HII [Anaerolineaceae bacterium]